MGNKKASRKERGLSPHPLSRRVSASTDSGSCPDFRLPLSQRADHSGGTVADFHSLPTTETSSIVAVECKPRSVAVSIKAECSAVLPLRSALFNQRAQT